MRLYRLGIAIALASGACSRPSASEDASVVDATEPIPPGCGDGVKSATEACDQTDLGGATCASAAAPGWMGIVSCTVTCRVNIAGCNIPSSTWNSFTETRNWVGYDVSKQFTNPPAEGFASSVFDGRYLYLVPHFRSPVTTYSGLVVRYDTASEFASSGSWTTFDLAVQKSAAAKGYMGGAFDGRYVYFIPHNNGAYHGTFARYDTQHAAGSQDPGVAFKDPAAWETFDVATLPGAPKGFATAAFDGRYVYLAPYANATNTFHGNIVRYDTRGPFTRDSWETFDLTSITPTAKGFLGSVFDGRYVYLVPYAYAHSPTTTLFNRTVMRFDTRAGRGLSDTTSWTSHEAPNAGFHSGAFDGRYVYFIPFQNGAGFSGVVTRVDTKADFTDDMAWSTFNVATPSVSTAAKGFIGGTFDGRYLYLAPYANGPGAFDGFVARFDTTADFTQPTSWSVFSMPTAVAGAVGYFGAAFDGKNVYFIPHRTSVPNPSGLVVKFDAKSPGWLPLHWNGGFN